MIGKGVVLSPNDLFEEISEANTFLEGVEDRLKIVLPVFLSSIIIKNLINAEKNLIHLKLLEPQERYRSCI